MFYRSRSFKGDWRYHDNNGHEYITSCLFFFINSWIQTAHGEYTGILPGTIDQQEAITKIGIDLSDLEVLFLEINPNKPSDFGKIKQLLTDWCNGMGIRHVDVVCTDLPRNNHNTITDFLEKDGI